MSAPAIEAVSAPAVAWEVSRWVFGDGLSVSAGGRWYDLVPYVAGDGSGRVGGYALQVDRAQLGRFPGPIDFARAVAEAEIRASLRP